MAFSLCEKDNIQWVTSDVLGTKHLFSRRLGDVGDFPFSSKPDPEWESESRQERVRALWQRFRTAAEFPAEGFCFTRQVHGTVLRYVTEAERAMPPLPHPPEDCDGLITGRTCRSAFGPRTACRCCSATRRRASLPPRTAAGRGRSPI